METKSTLQNMPIKTLIIGVIKKGNKVLMRKKFAGSPPYTETWYSFGCDMIAGKDPGTTFESYTQSLLKIKVAKIKSLLWDIEIKEDYDGISKQFVYLNMEFEHVYGELIIPEGLERVEWITQEKLSSLDIVPPSVALFKKLGYLN